VSVSGEFQRVLGECVELLRACHEPELERWSDELDAAGRAGREDLCAGAERALGVLGEARSAAPGSQPGAEFSRRSEHLGAICHVILGR